MQFKVPQDVQRKDTIIWSLTLQQMIICGIGGGFAYAIYIYISKTYMIETWLPPVVIISAITLAFAFLKIHSLPFHEFLMDFIEYHILPKKRIWIQGADCPFISPFDESKKKTEKIKSTDTGKPQQSLKELTKTLDTQGGVSELKDMDSNELQPQEKKEELKKLINQNYQATKSPII